MYMEYKNVILIIPSPLNCSSKIPPRNCAWGRRSFSKLSPSIYKFDDEFIQTSAERLDMSSSTCLSRSPQDLVLPSAMSPRRESSTLSSDRRARPNARAEWSEHVVLIHSFTIRHSICESKHQGKIHLRLDNLSTDYYRGL